MLRRRAHESSKTSKALPPLVEIPSGHVRLVEEHEPPEGEPVPGDGWMVRDGHGVVVLTELASRGEALRAMGGLALRGAELPLAVLRPDGLPTGDHLA